MLHVLPSVKPRLPSVSDGSRLISLIENPTQLQSVSGGDRSVLWIDQAAFDVLKIASAISGENIAPGTVASRFILACAKQHPELMQSVLKAANTEPPRGSGCFGGDNPEGAA